MPWLPLHSRTARRAKPPGQGSARRLPSSFPTPAPYAGRKPMKNVTQAATASAALSVDTAALAIGCRSIPWRLVISNRGRAPRRPQRVRSRAHRRKHLHRPSHENRGIVTGQVSPPAVRNAPRGRRIVPRCGMGFARVNRARSNRSGEVLGTAPDPDAGVLGTARPGDACASPASTRRGLAVPFAGGGPGPPISPHIPRTRRSQEGRWASMPGREPVGVKRPCPGPSGRRATCGLPRFGASLCGRGAVSSVGRAADS